jgi:hypothetical protein
MKCYRTVDTQKREADLAAKEQTHICGFEELLDFSDVSGE